MLGSAVLDTAIGVVLIFAVTALLASGVTEFVSNVLQWRAKYLLTGLRRLLEDPGTRTSARADGKALLATAKTLATATPHDTTEKILASATVQAATAPRSFLAVKGVRFPSYLSSTAFRTALLDTLLPGTLGPNETSGDILASLGTSVEALPDSRMKQALQAFLKTAQGDIANVETAVEKWYDDQMARVSGWYKRYTQVILAVVGLIAAVLLNIDTLQVGHTLWTDEPLRSAVASAATSGAICQNATDATTKASCASDELTSLKASGIPIGWRSDCSLFHGGTNSCWTWDEGSAVSAVPILLKIVGWLLTALAVSFGAPFWFDALSKLGSLRSAGAKPTDSSG